MTFKLTRFVLALAAIMSVGALAQTGSAASTPAPSVPATTATPKIGIINMQQAILASNEGRKEFESLQKKFEPKQAELKNMNDEVEGLKKKGVIDKGMRPKVASAVRALQEGVQRVHFVDGRQPHSLLLEIFTDKGVGTEIVHG